MLLGAMALGLMSFDSNSFDYFEDPSEPTCIELAIGLADIVLENGTITVNEYFMAVSAYASL